MNIFCLLMKNNNRFWILSIEYLTYFKYNTHYKQKNNKIMKNIFNQLMELLNIPTEQASFWIVITILLFCIPFKPGLIKSGVLVLLCIITMGVLEISFNLWLIFMAILIANYLVPSFPFFIEYLKHRKKEKLELKRRITRNLLEWNDRREKEQKSGSINELYDQMLKEQIKIDLTIWGKKKLW